MPKQTPVADKDFSSQSHKHTTSPELAAQASKSSFENVSRPESPKDEPIEKPRVRWSQEAIAPKPPASVLPLLVDARSAASTNGASADEAGLNSPSGARESAVPAPLWPEKIRSGGATCTAPRISTKKNRLVHQPLGEVLLLGAGLRAVLPEATLAAKAEVSLLAEATESVCTSPESPKQQASEEERQAGTGPDRPKRPDSNGRPSTGGNSAGRPSRPSTGEKAMRGWCAESPQEVSALPSLVELMISTTRQEAKGCHPMQMPGRHRASATRPHSRETPLQQPHSSAKGQQHKQSSATKATEQSSPPGTAGTASECASMPPCSQQAGAVDVLLEPELSLQVSTSEVALQTDFPSAGWSAMNFQESAEEQRILIMPCCNPRQIDFSSWNAIPKPEVPMSAERSYLSHVRTRFPGTTEGPARLVNGAHDKRKTAPHVEALRRKLAAAQAQAIAAGGWSILDG